MPPRTPAGRTARARIAFLAVLSSVAALGVSATAAPPTVLRIAGRSTAYTDITFSAPVRFEDIKANVRTKGTYAGWWIFPVGKEPTSKTIQAGGMHHAADPSSPNGPTAVLGSLDDHLAPGRYRLVLATDGDTVIDVPAHGLARSLTVRPSRRTTSAAGARPLKVLPGGVIADEVQQPTVLPSSALVLVSTLALAQPGVTHRHLKSCVTQRDEQCRGAPATSGETVSLDREHGVTLIAVYYPGEYEPGPADTVHAVTTTPGSTRAWGFYAWIEVP